MTPTKEKRTASKTGRENLIFLRKETHFTKIMGEDIERAVAAVIL